MHDFSVVPFRTCLSTKIKQHSAWFSTTMQTVQKEDKELAPPSPDPLITNSRNGNMEQITATVKNGLHLEEPYKNGHAHNSVIEEKSSDGDDDEVTEVDGKHRHCSESTCNVKQHDNTTILQKLRGYRKGSASANLTDSKSRQPAADASDAFPFGNSSRNQQYAPTARAPPDFFSDTYFMNHQRRGDCVMINNRKFEPHLQLNERKGSDRDATMLKFRFEELGFRVFTLVDATVRDMVEVAQFASEVDQSDADCFIMVTLSHGDENGIYGIDGRVTADKLYEPFKGDKCLSLAGKPKIFLTQACRGDRLDAGVDLAAVANENTAMEEADAVTFQRIPREADFLYSFSTVPGYYSWRNTENGSWYVQCLCNELQQHARNPNMDFVRLLTRVNRRVALEFESNTPSISSMHKKKQVPSIVSTLTKDLILNAVQQNSSPEAEAEEEVFMDSASNTTTTTMMMGKNGAVSRQTTSSTTTSHATSGNYAVIQQRQQVVARSKVPPQPPTRRQQIQNQRAAG